MTSKEKFCTALFCCEPYVFLVGVIGGKLFLIDTHPVNQDLGGNGQGGLVKVYHDCSPKACEALCGWIWKRLRTGGGFSDEEGGALLSINVSRNKVSINFFLIILSLALVTQSTDRQCKLSPFLNYKLPFLTPSPPFLPPSFLPSLFIYVIFAVVILFLPPNHLSL